MCLSRRSCETGKRRDPKRGPKRTNGLACHLTENFSDDFVAAGGVFLITADAGVGPAAARWGASMAACRLLRGRIITLCPALQISQPTEPTVDQCSTSPAWACAARREGNAGLSSPP